MPGVQTNSPMSAAVASTIEPPRKKNPALWLALVFAALAVYFVFTVLLKTFLPESPWA